MVDNNELALKYGGALEKINEKKEIGKKCSRTVELFFSFDIVNSSSYKDVNYFGWQVVLTSLLTNVQRNIAKEIPEAQLWRVLGDEIIFFVTIRNIEEVYTSIDAIYGVLVKSNVKLHNGSFFEELEEEYEKKDIDLMITNNILAIQATSWLAIILNGENSFFHTYDNVFKKYNINENQQINEFLGQDIDIGFRIKKETQDRRLVVSIELAKILSEKTEYLSRLNIITYKSLKGVWKNRLYPIIWYHDVEISGGLSFEDSFYYDETIFSQLSKDYFLNRENNEGDLAAYMFSDVHKALNKVIKDQQLVSKMEHIYEIINETESDVKAVENEFRNKLLEFHCAAVCCDLASKRILIAKRKDRVFFQGQWEFGCAKANIEQNLSDSIIEEYKNDFGIDIEIICDQEREDKEPIPIALYQIDKVEKLQKGVIVIGKIMGGLDKIAETVKEKGKHEEYKLIARDEIDAFDELAIHDFKDTLRKVFNLWNEVFEEK
ncbi:hypothetical protein LJC58_07475 [Lachnospiraceae bacterium OttesenSCG-928-D06]|nr:hypothetical protein [Lachnospiraceae bacterium OttesenSCG-928-D06]